MVLSKNNSLSLWDAIFFMNISGWLDADSYANNLMNMEPLFLGNFFLAEWMNETIWLNNPTATRAEESYLNFAKHGAFLV